MQYSLSFFDGRALGGWVQALFAAMDIFPRRLYTGGMNIPNEAAVHKVLSQWKTDRGAGHSVRRFSTGNQHYVYDVLLQGGCRAVVRLSAPEQRNVARAAAYWNEQLRKLGLPLPEILWSDLEGTFPCLILQRLPGRDLGAEIHAMSQAQRDKLAWQLMDCQKIVGSLPMSRRYGYAREPELAPHESWMDFLLAELRRASGAGTNWNARLEHAIRSQAGELEAVQPRAFLHDITTKNVIVEHGSLSGIVDVDDLCYGDPLWHIALTRMGLLSIDAGDLGYVESLLEHGGWEAGFHTLDLYTALMALEFISELTRDSNGNPMDRSAALVAGRDPGGIAAKARSQGLKDSNPTLRK